MSSISTRTRKDGSVAYRVNFRAIPGGPPTSETFETAAEATKFASMVDRIGGAAARELRDAQAAPKIEMTKLGDYALKRIAGFTGIAPDTRTRYRRLYTNWISEYLGSIPVMALTRRHCESWLLEISQTPSSTSASGVLSEKTMRNICSLLVQILDAAVTDRLCESNVASNLNIPETQKLEAVMLTKREFDQIYAAMNGYAHQRVIGLLAASGLRIGEALALTWADIAPDGTVSVSKAWKGDGAGRRLGPPKTKKAYRDVQITMAALKDLGPRGKPTEFVFLSSNGTPPTTQKVSKAWREARSRATAADPDFTKWPRLHDIRHSHISWLVAAGVPLNIVQRRAGHESITTTMDRYSHLLPDAQAQAVAALEGL